MFEIATKILRLPRDCDREEVRRAYLRLVRRYPPEHFPERFKRIKQAYEEMSLEPSSLEPALHRLAQVETPREAMEIMLEEALDAAMGQETDEPTRPGCMELEPVLRADSYREELAGVLERIGREHSSPEEENQ